VLSAIAIAGVGVSLAASGHAATAPPQVADPADGVSLHGVGVRLLGRRADAIGGDGVAAGRWAAGCREPVFTRGGAGRGRAVCRPGLGLRSSQLESFRSLIETRYGLILSLKLALVVVLLGLAALNRFPSYANACPRSSEHAPSGSIDPARMCRCHR